ncbi:MAG: arylsulfatase [Thermoguttaceae bacterium]|jgi:arylsulfatase|nr:arylsulfatase [Thermoguttaceae bacterium]
MKMRWIPGAGLLALLAVLDTVRAEAPTVGRPNFLIILADDAGFSDLGCYGGEIETPHLDRLAQEGLRFTHFYSTARCWPSRAALMTGYYAQQVRMDPVRRQFRRLPPWARVLPHYLEPAGYRSYHSGKWHIALADRPVADGGFHRSYRMRDHDRFFSPRVHLLDDERLPEVEPGTDFYTTTEMANRAIEFLKQHEEEHQGKPWLTFLAFTSPHFPLHAPQADIDKYRNRYDAGWDEVRRQRLERMKAMGIVPGHVQLPPLEPEVVPGWNMITSDMERQFGTIADRKGPPWVRLSLDEVFGPGEVGRAVPWDSLSAEQKEFQAAKMAIHAAMIDRMDQEIGRVLAQIEAMGDLENTLVMVMSDNGASAEIIVRGDGHDRDAPMGSAASYLSLGPGWSTAANTPLRLHKHWTHEGGAASPLVVHWPAGIGQQVAGQLRTTPGHFVDILPTVLEAAGIEYQPPAPGGPPLPGRSLLPAFAANGEIARDFIYLEHSGHRGLRVGDWKIVSRTDDEDRWKLYNLAEDRNELNDLAHELPAKARQMADRWQELHQEFERQATTRYDEPE